MATAQESIDLIITNALETANEYTEAAGDAAEDILRLAGGSSSTYVNNSQAALDILAIEPDVPEADDATYTYEAQLDKLIALLSGQLADFFRLYYPLENDAFGEAIAWLKDSIVNGGSGINTTIENGIWQRGRDRQIADGRRVQSQILAGASSKGMVLPAGSIEMEVRESLFQQAANNGTASIDIATKQAELEIENVRFAVGKAVESRFAAMNAATDYVRAMASAPDAAARVAALNTDVKAKMIAATADLYRARLRRDDMIMRTDIANAGLSVDVAKLLIGHSDNRIDLKVRAATNAAEVYARTASAALTSLNSVVSSATNAFS